jgi:hypothetical protein
MYGTDNIDMQLLIEHGLDTELWIWGYMSKFTQTLG